MLTFSLHGNQVVSESSVLGCKGHPGSSDAFEQFLEDIGDLVPLHDLGVFAGGLDTAGGADGEFALAATDILGAGSVTIFHTPALMPDGHNSRKR
jgi:hypothetical protein